MHKNISLLTEFYDAFQHLDAERMVSCYHQDAEFKDPVFPDLDYQGVTSMWRMLCGQAKAFSLTYSDIDANDTNGRAKWEATYAFSQTGRTVHNIIEAQFEFKDGLIYRHRDNFDLWRWSRMALGPAGVLLGWTPLLQNKIRSMADKNLRSFISKRQQQQSD